MRDIKTAPNAVISYGKYTGGDLVLWECRCILELLPGDALFFMGSLITHWNKDIQSGIRNSINLFTHKSNVDFKAIVTDTRNAREAWDSLKSTFKQDTGIGIGVIFNFSLCRSINKIHLCRRAGIPLSLIVNDTGRICTGPFPSQSWKKAITRVPVNTR